MHALDRQDAHAAVNKLVVELPQVLRPEPGELSMPLCRSGQAHFHVVWSRAVLGYH